MKIKIARLKEWLIKDNDFKSLCEGKYCEQLINDFIDGIDNIDNYKLDKNYYDLAYLKLGKDIYNLDDLYNDFKGYIEEN